MPGSKYGKTTKELLKKFVDFCVSSPEVGA